jgi:hypothetical protein
MKMDIISGSVKPAKAGSLPALFLLALMLCSQNLTSCSHQIHKRGTLTRINKNCPAYDKTPTKYWNKPLHKAYK